MCASGCTGNVVIVNDARTSTVHTSVDFAGMIESELLMSGQGSRAAHHGVIGAMNIRLQVSNPSIRPGESRSTLGIQHTWTLFRDW